MNLSDEAKALAARNSARKDQEFDRWMGESITRLATSMVPAGEHPDVLRTLLRSAFDHGFDVGVSEILGDLIRTIMSDKDGRRRP